MSTIQETITQLGDAKTAIKEAVALHGVTIPSAAPLNTYAHYIDQIGVGGGGGGQIPATGNPIRAYFVWVDEATGHTNSRIVYPDESGAVSYPDTWYEGDIAAKTAAESGDWETPALTYVETVYVYKGVYVSKELAESAMANLEGDLTIAVRHKYIGTDTTICVRMTPRDLTIENVGTMTGEKTVDWGDGTVENTSTFAHTYATKGNYTIKITGGDDIAPSTTIDDKVIRVYASGGAYTEQDGTYYHNFAPAFMSLLVDWFFNEFNFLPNSAYQYGWCTTTPQIVNHSPFTLGDEGTYTTTAVRWYGPHNNEIFNAIHNFSLPIDLEFIASAGDYGLFSYNYAFNQPLSLPALTTISGNNGLFSYNYAFNQPLSLPALTTISGNNGLFNQNYAFNQPLSLPALTTISGNNGLFYNNYAFNQPLSLPALTTIGNYGLFNQNYAFNQPLSLPALTTIGNYGLFSYNYAFNQPLSLPALTTIGNYGLFSYNYAFNQPLSLPALTTISGNNGLFSYNYAFNQPLSLPALTTIGNNGLFSYNYAFNQPLSLPALTTISGNNGLFSYNYAFNQPISLPALTTISGSNGLFYSDKAFGNVIILGETPPTSFPAATFLATKGYAIVVPDESVEAYKASSAFASVADYIEPISNYRGDMVE